MVAGQQGIVGGPTRAVPQEPFAPHRDVPKIALVLVGEPGCKRLVGELGHQLVRLIQRHCTIPLLSARLFDGAVERAEAHAQSFRLDFSKLVVFKAFETGEKAANEAAQRFLREGRVVRIARAPVGMDFNDVLVLPENVVPFDVRKKEPVHG